MEESLVLGKNNWLIFHDHDEICAYGMLVSLPNAHFIEPYIKIEIVHGNIKFLYFVSKKNTKIYINCLIVSWNYRGEHPYTKETTRTPYVCEE